jgi:broad-specificity NMP kinase
MLVGSQEHQGRVNIGHSAARKKPGYQIIHLNELIKDEKLYSEVDTERDCVVADMDQVEQRVMEKVDRLFLLLFWTVIFPIILLILLLCYVLLLKSCGRDFSKGTILK